MKKIILGTTNPAKLEQIRMALAGADIEIEGLPQNVELRSISEDGTTAQENAHIKATAYAKALGQPVLSMDVALFFQSNPDDDQPGVHIRRINGRTDRVTDEEIIQHYQAWIDRLGRIINGHYEFAFCLASPQGEHCETTVQTPPRIFTSQLSKRLIPGYPLESLSIDAASGHYISEMSPEEIQKYWENTIGPVLKPLIEDCPFL